jgi:hypothetical protein
MPNYSDCQMVAQIQAVAEKKVKSK